MPISLEVIVEDLESALQLYDRIQVHKNWEGDIDGTYVEITDDSPGPALLAATAGGPFTVSGLALSIELNGADPFVVTFSGTNPLSLGQVLDQINLTYPGLATLTENNLLLLRSPLSGTGSSLRAFGPALAPLFLPTSISYGKGARIPIGLQNTTYSFTDLSGDELHYYKTRFYSTVTKAVSAFSDPFQGLKTVVLPPEEFVIGSLNLIDAAGAPLPGRRVILVPVSPKIVQTNNTAFAMLPGADRLEMITDGTGYAEIKLVIGTRLRVFFEGSGYAREFDVPDEDFDILTVISTQPDPFSIVQAPPMPIRES